MIDLNDKNILISRTDSIGDVMLTLPICAWLKKQFPTCHILFLGKGYTKDIIEAYTCVDAFYDWNDFSALTQEEQVNKLKRLSAEGIIHVFPNKEIASLAKKAKINIRVGTSHRLFHLTTCNHKVNFTRKNSTVHEAQLNHELLRPFGLESLPSLDEVIKMTQYFKPAKVELPAELDALNGYTILHPKSQGSAKEWPIEKYMTLAQMLVSDGETVLFTGTEGEGATFRNEIPAHERIIDTTGKLTLRQLITLIEGAKNVVACSTGPLHIAGYLGINTVGIFSPRRPIHPGRWKALGPNVHALVFDEDCPKCKAKKDCDCIKEITIEQVVKELAK